MTCDVLNLEWSSSGRDREVATLICEALRRRGHRVVEGSIFNYRYLLLKHRPRVLYLADPSGARLNYEVALFAERAGIPAVCLDAEGNYLSDMADEMFWGHITDRRLPVRLKLQWSERAREAVLAVAPEVRGSLRVTGGAGFDRYRLYAFACKHEWRKRHGISQDRVYGYATWAFDYLYGDEDTVRRYAAIYGEAALDRFRRDRDALRELLKELVCRNEDALFLLKEHPGVTNSAATEIAELDRLPNVLKIKNEESIGDCISVCDVWMAYDSTTAIEAWLLDKPTLFINPSGGDFQRASVHQGNPVLETAEAVGAALREHVETGEIPGFEARREARRAVLAATLQWTDGRNHLRAAHYIDELLQASPERPRFSLTEALQAYAQNALFAGAKRGPSLPGFRRYAAAQRRFDDGQVEQARRRAAEATSQLEPTLRPEELAELEALNA
jgi:hypothetical protein